MPGEGFDSARAVHEIVDGSSRAFFVWFVVLFASFDSDLSKDLENPRFSASKTPIRKILATMAMPRLPCGRLSEPCVIVRENIAAVVIGLTCSLGDDGILLPLASSFLQHGSRQCMTFSGRILERQTLGS